MQVTRQLERFMSDEGDDEADGAGSTGDRLPSEGGSRGVGRGLLGGLFGSW